MGTRGKLTLRYGVLAAAAALCVVGVGSAAYAANPGPNQKPDPAADALLAPTANQKMQQTLALLEKYNVDDRNADYKGAYSLEQLDNGTKLLARYSTNHPASARLLEALKQVQKEAPLPIELVPFTFDLAKSNVVAAQIMAKDSILAVKYGLTPTIAVVDQATGTVNVETSDTSPEAQSLGTNGELMVALDGVNIDVRIGSGKPIDYQYSRNSDAAPWSGGIALDNGAYGVTASFTWRHWGDNELMLATAEHAWEESGVSTWYNNGVVGTRYYYNTATDATLLRSSPLSQFNPNIYVGSSTTTDVRPVVGALNNLPLGTALALDGRWGLQAATSVGWQGAYSSRKGPFVLTYSGSCQPGDSGGPWIQTDASGNVIAAGQHVGRAYYSGAYRCIISPLGPISTAMGASIYTG